MFHLDRLISLTSTLCLAGVIVGAGYVGLRLTHAQLAADVYRDRLAELTDHYQLMRQQYNEAIRRTAVTELVVQEGKLSVHVRTAEGTLAVVPTDIDPQREVYVDYVVKQGRLWIRRVFDDATPPANGVTIDPGLASVDWSDPGLAHGQAVYRRLEEGRWVVTVTGSGALGLNRLEETETADLAPPPTIRDYEQVEQEVSDRLEQVSTADVLRHLIGR